MNKRQNKEKQRFEGFYFKQQNKDETVAFIAARHSGEDSRPLASLQIITDAEAFNVDFPAEQFFDDRKRLIVRLGNSIFSKNGVSLNIERPELSLYGKLSFGTLALPAYDIMGPFAAVPFMECRHSVYSLFHKVNGCVTINGREYKFLDGSGYIEGDRGTSFPKRYIWTHCCFNGNSIMMSLADIPVGPFSFIGCTGFIYLNGKERRIATYLGGGPLHIGQDCVILRQGGLMLEIRLLKENSYPLYAPKQGRMTSIIHESASCMVRYKCSEYGKVIFDFISEHASFENNWMNVQ
ncbi:MAG: hypothetical protein VB078_02485 [Clostridiaceae bacterium]|nr:hypothetical protein [Clostridiaceae bacterium]